MDASPADSWPRPSPRPVVFSLTQFLSAELWMASPLSSPSRVLRALRPMLPLLVWLAASGWDLLDHTSKVSVTLRSVKSPLAWAHCLVTFLFFALLEEFHNRHSHNFSKFTAKAAQIRQVDTHGAGSLAIKGWGSLCFSHTGSSLPRQPLAVNIPATYPSPERLQILLHKYHRVRRAEMSVSKKNW